MPKIVLIGAGSAMFTRGLMADLIQAPDLGPWEVGLVDVDPGALETAEGLCRRMVAARQAAAARRAEIRLSASLDRRDLLGGADVVVTTIGVGGRRAWEADVFIPRRFGVYQPVGDSVMPGGTSRALRMIPAMVDIAKDVQDLAPDALFFNYANPMSAICRAVRKATGAEQLAFFAAIAPIVYADTIDMSKAWMQSRYDKGEQDDGDYINCPMTREEYDAFCDALLEAETGDIPGACISARENVNVLANEL